jgi:hypothetical protein
LFQKAKKQVLQPRRPAPSLPPITADEPSPSIRDTDPASAAPPTATSTATIDVAAPQRVQTTGPEAMISHVIEPPADWAMLAPDALVAGADMMLPVVDTPAHHITHHDSSPSQISAQTETGSVFPEGSLLARLNLSTSSGNSPLPVEANSELQRLGLSDDNEGVWMMAHCKMCNLWFSGCSSFSCFSSSCCSSSSFSS